MSITTASTGSGTGISSAISAGVAALQGGSPIEIAIHATYGAIPIPPGVRQVTDTVLDVVLRLALHGAPLTDIAIHAARDQVAAYLAQPWNTVLFLSLIAAMFYHLLLGIQVVVEDYVHQDATRLVTMLIVRGVIIFCALASAVSVLKLAF